MLWLAVTPDKYELPLAVADTAEELSYILGLNKDEVRRLYYLHNKGICRQWSKYKIVKVKEDKYVKKEKEA